jgi:hypothetical protein
LELLTDTKLSEARLPAAEYNSTLQVKEKSVLMTCRDLLNDGLISEINSLRCAKILFREAKLAFAIVSPRENVLGTCWWVKRDTYSMFATTWNIKHWKVSNCIDQNWLRAVFDCGSFFHWIGLSVLGTNAKLSMHVVSHDKQHFWLGDKRSVILPACDFHNVLGELQVYWKPYDLAQESFPKTQLSSMVRSPHDHFAPFFNLRLHLTLVFKRYLLFCFFALVKTFIHLLWLAWVSLVLLRHKPGLWFFGGLWVPLSSLLDNSAEVLGALRPQVTRCIDEVGNALTQAGEWHLAKRVSRLCSHVHLNRVNSLKTLLLKWTFSHLLF